MIIRKTFLGGLATAVFLVVAISVSVSMGLSYGIDNILETKALVHLEALEQEYGTVTYIQFYSDEIDFSFSFINYGGDCGTSQKCSDIVKVDQKNIEGKILNESCEQIETTCKVAFKCSQCELTKTGSITVTISEEESYATDIYVTVSSSSSIPDEKSTISTVISAESGKYFRGLNPSQVYLLMTPSIFRNDSGEWEDMIKGYHISQLEDPQKGSELYYPE